MRSGAVARCRTFANVEALVSCIVWSRILRAVGVGGCWTRRLEGTWQGWMAIFKLYEGQYGVGQQHRNVDGGWECCLYDGANVTIEAVQPSLVERQQSEKAVIEHAQEFHTPQGLLASSARPQQRRWFQPRPATQRPSRPGGQAAEAGQLVIAPPPFPSASWSDLFANTTPKGVEVRRTAYEMPTERLTRCRPRIPPSE
jgi:hypothetical protein